MIVAALRGAWGDSELTVMEAWREANFQFRLYDIAGSENKSCRVVALNLFPEQAEQEEHRGHCDNRRAQREIQCDARDRDMRIKAADGETE